MKRILITGSRKMTNIDLMRDALRIYGPGVIVHGAAPGADTLASEVAYEFGWPEERHPAQWNTYKKAAGPIRNKEMVKAGADVCIAFPIGQSDGTRDCMAQAKAAGIPVFEISQVKNV